MASAPSFDGQERRALLPPIMPAELEVPDGRWLGLSGEIFATGWRVDVVRADHAQGDDSAWLATLQQRCCAILEAIDAQMSPWRATSDLVRFNRARDGEFALPEPMRTVVTHAIETAQLTDGAFDPTLHDAVALWGFSAQQVTDGLPEAELLATLTKTRKTWRDLHFDGERITAQPGLTLDLCAIAKGHAVDAVMAAVQAMPDAEAALVEIGGELKGWCIRPDGMPWWVAIEGPDGALPVPTMAALCGWAVATSGDYRRAFTHDGAQYSHAIDPQTLAPVRTGIASATIFDPDCWRADALATAMMVMGRKDALAFANTHAVPCLLQVREPGGIVEYMSEALQAWLDDDD